VLGWDWMKGRRVNRDGNIDTKQHIDNNDHEHSLMAVTLAYTF
jgi:hypothetical protein